MNSPYITLLVLCLTGLLIRNGYEILKKAGKIDPQNKLVLAVVIAGDEPVPAGVGVPVSAGPLAH